MANPPPPALASSLGNGKLVCLLMVLFLVSQSTIGYILGPIGHDLLQLQLFTLYKPSLFKEILNQWSAEEKMRFERHYDLDYWIHPSIYGSLFMAWLTHETAAAGYSPYNYYLFLITPALAGFCDFLENSLQLGLAKGTYAMNNETIQLASFFATLKWSLIIPTGLWCLVTAVKRVRRGVNQGSMKRD